MADAITDIPTLYATTFPDDTREWTHAPLGETTLLQLMQGALDRGSQVLPEEVDAVCLRLLGMPLSGALAHVPVPPVPEPEPEAAPKAEAEEGARTR